MSLETAEGEHNFKTFLYLLILTLVLPAVLQNTIRVACNFRILHANLQAAFLNFEKVSVLDPDPCLLCLKDPDKNFQFRIRIGL